MNAGVTGTYKFNKHLGIKLEANITQRGKSYSFSETDHLFTSFNNIIGMLIDTSLINQYKDILTMECILTIKAIIN